ncbi:MAG: GNAT family N-acetyltransferase [Verrucomicrobia bacterium]|nr:GNAT family N-acetyltransferase [Verrucomicrobiota bacterium]
MEWSNGEHLLSDDKRRLDLDAVCRLLNETYWAAGRPRSVIAKGIEHSVCLGLFHSGKQVGFARAVTDFATFTWICDVIIAPAHRGKGLGKWMVKCLIEHPQLQTRSQVLATRDARTLYERYGFQRTEYLKRMPGVHPQTETKPGSCC